MSSEGADGFLLLILSSPSGAGKTTLCNRLRSEFPRLRFSVSHTTRKPRPTEVDGREYHFVDRPTFEQMVLFDIDYQGARQIKAHLPEAIGVFVLPPSLAELERRLRGRGTEDEATTVRRLEAAKREIAHYGLFDYVVVNDDVDAAYGRIRGIVLAERCKRRRWALRCEALLSEAKTH
jgi:guanylate kinase